MAILKTEFPKKSILNYNIKKYHYVDSFQGTLTDKEDRFNWIDIGKAFFLSGSKWVGALFALRNKIVFIFGLKTPGSKWEIQSQRDNFRFEQGQRIGLFKVLERTENEVIFGEDDKHLNFRISLLVEQQKNSSQLKNLTFSSLVEYNNWFGRLYFLIVKPFHKLIVVEILTGVIKELEKK